jgi:hypothetical protein
MPNRIKCSGNFPDRIQPKNKEKLTKFVQAALDYYEVLCNDPSGYDFTWSEELIEFSQEEANSFFIGVLLDQGQPADRAWAGGESFAVNIHLVRIHPEPKDEQSLLCLSI